MKWATQGNAGVNTPGRAQEMTGPGTWCYAGVNTVMFNIRLNLVMWEVFSSLNDFRILSPVILEEIHRAAKYKSLRDTGKTPTVPTL